MGLKESLKELQKKEKLNVKREVKKELTKIKKETQKDKKCTICQGVAKYFLKGTNHSYCKNCALENFSDLEYLQKI
ncbi:MAG: hypothetical protein ACP5NV_03090 [Candidatus Woesearchaeota archaeon]